MKTRLLVVVVVATFAFGLNSLNATVINKTSSQEVVVSTDKEKDKKVKSGECEKKDTEKKCEKTAEKSDCKKEESSCTKK